MSGTTKRLSAVISGRHCRINCAHKEGHTVIAPYAYPSTCLGSYGSLCI
jgi:hypothetical protein